MQNMKDFSVHSSDCCTNCSVEASCHILYVFNSCIFLLFMYINASVDVIV